MGKLCIQIGDYDSGYLPGTATLHTIPGSAVTESGEYGLFVAGGTNCDTTAAGNLNGAEGYFTGISTRGITIIAQ